ncbi:hypothetical protein GK047_14265 [Paenibacillus sp. SYP-B3998]|uniref:Calx-beta domain-containing protein n=1 Tax=Paenibacillus sp. SYP-B3998 TaxID=2678564 RepID=A0A6G4A014_9BACL|nr:Calx-beta domain-containing protein [Paenibacillus sp. SYP-B3998]NEW07169.1 hypothetical protein [Paenibacillus sp. SYP-B3998]
MALIHKRLAFVFFTVAALLTFLLPASASAEEKVIWYDPSPQQVFKSEELQTMVVIHYDVSKVTLEVEGRSTALEVSSSIPENQTYWYSGKLSLAGMQNGQKQIKLKVTSQSGEIIEQERTIFYENKQRVEFENASQMVDEESGQAVVKVVRKNGSSGVLTVKYMTIGGTAQSGKDFVPVQGVLAFASGETSKTIRIKLLDDSIKEMETFRLSLYEPSSACALGDFPTKTLILKDRD